MGLNSNTYSILKPKYSHI